MNRMNESEFRTKLCAELRSGNWNQIRERYRDDGCGRCAAGVVFEVIADMPDCTPLPYTAEFQRKLIKWNDYDLLTFPEIADCIEAQA